MFLMPLLPGRFLFYNFCTTMPNNEAAPQEAETAPFNIPAGRAAGEVGTRAFAPSPAVTERSARAREALSNIEHSEVMGVYENSLTKDRIQMVREGLKGAFTSVGSPEPPKVAYGTELPEGGLSSVDRTENIPQVFYKSLKKKHMVGGIEYTEALVLVRVNNGNSPAESTIMSATVLVDAEKGTLADKLPLLSRLTSEEVYNTEISNKRSLDGKLVRGEITSDYYIKKYRVRNDKFPFFGRTIAENQGRRDVSLKESGALWRSEVDRERLHVNEQLRGEYVRLNQEEVREVAQEVDNTQRALEQAQTNDKNRLLSTLRAIAGSFSSPEELQRHAAQISEVFGLQADSDIIAYISSLTEQARSRSGGTTPESTPESTNPNGAGTQHTGTAASRGRQAPGRIARTLPENNGNTVTPEAVEPPTTPEPVNTPKPVKASKESAGDPTMEAELKHIELKAQRDAFTDALEENPGQEPIFYGHLLAVISPENKQWAEKQIKDRGLSFEEVK
ncbi:MAG: hypothetical protein UU72_C0024G0028 [candidate division WWE3 bacterium GW2011_GWB1_41_6]|uniref:Uncharacterized protein n=1 Tax=candidate division WWE3 bacterium GW2011_GWB1_41_6 TaxID=1619112 RepID=A0A0G0WVY9_UNCKA|nr:MAG: hypothetical protein UU72_C0024G0028 [candidate division WWE3 bacterium GW2011_GWB1_41_6]